MALGDRFPQSFRDAVTQQRLVPGAVLYLPFQFPGEVKSKEKYMVIVAAVAPKLLLMTINTDINPFVSNTPQLNRCNVVVEKSSHSFLDYTSNLACHQVQTADLAVTEQLLSIETGRFRGVISEETKLRIIQVLATSPPSISKVHRDAITAALTCPAVAVDDSPQM
ncbi:MAG: hypothetical protein M3Y65_17080 [Pseudomonadota bacterium]|nr:hypothetical protein [Pseudomonadota bacterium]